MRSSSDTIDFSGYPHIDEVILSGPFNPTGPGDTPSRRRIFVCRPAAVAEEEACARRILSALARRAYRGDVTAADTDALMTFFRRGRQDGSRFDAGIDLALRRMLASPKFVFRVERDPQGAAAGRPYPLRDLELASRLSFFLWSTIPDDELLDLAAAGRLSQPATLERQVRRMLASPKAQALVDNFGGQWLQLRNLRNKQPNSHEYPDFDDNLRVALQTETEMFFASVVREDRSLVDLMTADYTFLNERLARHYGIPGVYGSHFRRVTLTDDARRGLLGKGAILMVTSHAHRTSPVLRGKWVLENVLGAPPPPPPDVVPPFEEDAGAAKPRSVRERMEAHRRNPACASCHRMIDPAGLALENFDGVGAWRTRDGGTRGTPVDASGQLVDGTTINGVVELRQALLRQPDTFVRTVTEKLMVYALGRGLTGTDMPAVRTVVREAARDNYRFSSLILGIVRSVPFRMRVAAPAAEASGARASRCTDRGREAYAGSRRRGRHVHHQVVAVTPNRSEGPGHHAGPAAARRHGAGAHADRADRRGAHHALRRGVRADGRASEPLDAGDQGRRLRVQPDPQADREVPRPRQRGLEPRPAAAGHPRRQHRHVADRQRTRSAPRPRTSVNGTSLDQIIANKIGQDTVFPSIEIATEDFTGYVGACDTGYSCAYMNTIVVEVADAADPARDQPARRVRAHVRPARLGGRARQADAAEPQHPRLGDRRRRLARARARRPRPRAPRPVPRARARD